MYRTAAVSLVLMIVTLAVYWQAGDHEFTNFDDGEYVYENPFVQKGLTFESIAWAFTTAHASNWHPLTWLSHMLDYELFGLNPGRHHLTSIFFHLANTLLLFLILHSMTGALWKSGIVAALFALHPLHVESVAWIAERKDVLSTFFWMLAVGAYVYYSKHPGLKRYIPVLVFFSLGIMAKPMVVTLPFVLLLLDYWPLCRISFDRDGISAPAEPRKSIRMVRMKRTALSLLKEKIPLFMLSSAGSAITFYVQNKRGAVRDLTLIPFGIRIANALVSYVKYIGKTICPSRLAVFYPHPGTNLRIWQAFGAGILLITITVLVIRNARKYPFMVTGWFWYLGILVPVIGLVQVGEQAMADRYTYLSIVGLFIIAVWGFQEIVGPWRFRNVMIPVIAGIMLAAGAAGTWVQAGYWHDNGVLYRHALEVTSGNYLAHNNLGAYLIEQKKYDEAIEHFDEALRFKPDYTDAHINLGVLLENQGRHNEAIAHFNEALRLDPINAKAHNNLGTVFDALGKHDEALELYKEALRLEPDYGRAHTNLARALLRLGKVDEAYKHFTEALRLEPQNAMTHNDMGVVLAVLGKHEAAVASYNEALRLDPECAEAHNNLGSEYLRLGKLDDALAHCIEALRLKPDYAEAQCNMGNVYLRLGKLRLAYEHYTGALRLKQDYPEAHYNLGNMYARQGDLDTALSHYSTALRSKPEYAEVHMNMGNVFFSRGNLDSALVHYNEALRLKPDYAEAQNNLGSVLFRLGRIDDAIDHYRKAVEIKSDYAEAQNNLENALKFRKKSGEND